MTHPGYTVQIQTIANPESSRHCEHGELPPRVKKPIFVQDIKKITGQIIAFGTPFAWTGSDISTPNSGQQGFRMG